MDYHPKDHPLPAAQQSTELAAAEAKYCLTAFDLAAAPLGSRDWTLYWAGWHARSRGTQTADDLLQPRVQPWLMACFGAMIAGDREERNHRFLEEALELVQSCGCTASEAHQLVDYVFGRPVGERDQEVGGVMITLAALCLANSLDMHSAGERELARIWTMVEKIRAKQAAKPKHSPLPVAAQVPARRCEHGCNGCDDCTDYEKEPQAPALWVSPEQAAAHTDLDHPEAGRYLPCRRTPAGMFTQPLYAHPAGAAQVPGSWQPIDTVPGTAEDLLLLTTSGKRKIETGWYARDLLEGAIREGESCVYTMWMHLPAAIAASTEGMTS
jgi:hypothetical protein